MALLPAPGLSVHHSCFSQFRLKKKIIKVFSLSLQVNIFADGKTDADVRDGFRDHFLCVGRKKTHAVFHVR